MGLTDYLSRNPVSKSEPIENDDKEYVIKFLILLMLIIDNHGSIDELGKTEIKTDNSEKREQIFNQSQASYQNKPKSSENITNDRILLLSSQQPVIHVNIQQPKEYNETITRMDIKNIEQLEGQDSTAEPLALSNRWKELVKPNDYMMTKGCRWSKITKDIQQKCDECVPCKMTGKSIKPQLLMSEIFYLPPADETNQETQLYFIEPMRYKQRRFFILVSIDRYTRWPAACICESPTGKTAKSFLEQNITLNDIPQTIRTDKGMAFTGKEFRDFCKNLNIKLLYGTPYIYTPTGLVERGTKTLKDYMKTNL